MNSLCARLAELLQNAPAEEWKKNSRAAAAAILARLNVADREEFDFRGEMLAQTAARLREMEERIARLEAAATPAKSAAKRKTAAKPRAPQKPAEKPE
ncbi:MAG: accessory factor UbiK family protein [Gammaproteobacteria bacterium]